VPIIGTEDCQWLAVLDVPIVQTLPDVDADVDEVGEFLVGLEERPLLRRICLMS
jgi:hypothetical protein